MRSEARDSAATIERIAASEDRIAEAAAQVTLLSEGNVARQSSYPHVFDANVVRRPRLRADNLGDALDRLAMPLLEIGARHLQIVCDAARLSEEVRAGLRRQGMGCERLLSMALPGRPARRADPAVVVQAVGEGAQRAWYAQTMERMSREEPWYSPRVAREIVGSLEAKAEVGTLALFVASLDGKPVGTAGLSIDEASRTASISTVGTVPEARHRRVAQSLVVTLAERALSSGCDLVYLIARADDTPKEMYRKFGFEVVHGFDLWLRPPR